MSDSLLEARKTSASGMRAARRRLAGVAAFLTACGGVAAIASTMIPASSTAGSTDPTGVILVSWDGARFDILKQLMHWQPISDTPVLCPGNDETLARMPAACGEFWSCLPTLCQFEIMESHTVAGKTLTRVQHATMLSGQPPEITTINSNNGSSKMPAGLTIYERLDEMVGGGIQFAHVGSLRYTVRGILNEVAETLIPKERIRSRGYPDKFTGRGSNSNFLPILPEFEGVPFFAFQHQKGIDLAGHGAGDRSAQYRIAFIAADDRLRELLDELVRLDMADRTHVFVTSDHGFWHSMHLGGRRPVIGKTWFASQKDKLLCYTRGNMVDAVPTILAVFGADPAQSVPALPGRSLLDPTRVGECIPPVCNNGVVEVGEDCEPALPLADTCESLDYLRGTIGCTEDCQYDTSDCADTLEFSALSIAPVARELMDINLRMIDRERGGPVFDPVRDAVMIELWSGENLVWQGATSSYDPGWRVYRDASVWSMGRGDHPDGLLSIRMPALERRLKMRVNAGPIEEMLDLSDVTALRTIIHVGRERFDADMACFWRDESGLRCSYSTPTSEAHEKRADRDRDLH